MLGYVVLHTLYVPSTSGGTNVSGALQCPPEEQRPIVSLDMTEMDKILWLDEENLTVCVEAGCVGQDLERKVSRTRLIFRVLRQQYLH